MDNEDQKEVLTPEEKAAEDEALKGLDDEELKTKLAEEYGIDPDDESELLEKLVAKEKVHHEKLSGAIKQKINWRTRAEKIPSKNPDKKDDKSQKVEVPSEEEIDRRIEARMAMRDLKDLSLPEELEEEVKELAALKKISVRDAAKLPYILSRKEEIDRDERVKNAIPKRGDKGAYKSSYDPSKPLDPSDFNFETKEGREAWLAAKEAKRKSISK